MANRYGENRGHYYDDNGRVITSGSEYRAKQYVSALGGMTIGGGAPTPVVASATSLGGYQLDDDTEKLQMQFFIDHDWDGVSDLSLEIYFSNNDVGAGGSDAVQVDAEWWYKAKGSSAMKTNSFFINQIVGTAGLGTLFGTNLVIDHDLVSHLIVAGDLLALELNLDTDTSDVDDITIHYAVLTYLTNKVRQTQ